MKKLVIAEKPKLAKSIIRGIGDSSFTSHDGYAENDKYIVTWAFGHLFTLFDVEEYSPDYDPDKKHSWTLDDIPFYPSKYRFKLKKDADSKRSGGVQKQYEVISTLVNRKDVNEIVNAGDSDREGEIIVRIILSFCNKSNKKVSRLWTNVQTPESLKEALENLKDDKEYDSLAKEGYARTYLDWLYGVNLTRYASIKSHKLLRVGRVISCIVKTIYDRDMAIKNFEPETYYNIASKEKTNGEVIELTSKKTFDKNQLKDAKLCCDVYNKEKAIVKKVEKTKKTIDPGHLYSLSALQGVVGQQMKLSPNDCLQTVQELYEAGFVTYPRTNTEYLANAEKGAVTAVINKLKEGGFPVAFRYSKSIFDDSKIESHSAICPTLHFPKEKELSDRQQKVYNIIRNRFIAVFCSVPCEVDRSTILISLGDKEDFKLSGDVVTQKGWMEYDLSNKKEKILPNLKEGDEVVVKFDVVKKVTTPPNHYTVKSLNAFLTNPLKKKNGEKNDEDDVEKYKDILAGLEIGTEATRGSIIENAIKSGYISLKNNNYYIEPDGVFYIQVLNKLELDLSPSRTANLNKLLKDVKKGVLSINEVLEQGKTLINEVFAKDVAIDHYSSAKEKVCKCPMCENDVIKTKYGFICTQYKKTCTFALPKKVANKTLSNSVVKKLVESKHSNLIKGFTSSKGKKFDAFLQLELDEKPQLKFVFKNDDNAKEKVNSPCPVCGANVINDRFAWRCEDKCGFAIGYEICGRKMTKDEAEIIISNGKSDLLNGFISKKGKRFSAFLKLDDKKVVFEFEK